jgi:single-strand DNA-binding protein
VNCVALIGNLATDVELRELAEDRKVASFLLAVDRIGSEEADFIRVATWNRQAELCDQYLSKGRRVGVEGRLRSSSWEDAEGKRRSSVEIVASRVEFLGGPRDGGAEGADVIPFEAAAAS